MLYIPISIILFLTFSFAQRDDDWLCESLICDPPKKCVLVDQVAQCLIDSSPSPPLFGTINGGQPLFSGPSSSPPPAPPVTSPAPTTPPSPFAPFLNLLNGVTPGGGGSAPPFTLPSLPTLPPFPTTPTSSTPQPIDICTLPPITGSCSRARIMWYYDTESRRCERFSWSGCGNENRFSSKAQCEQTCAQNS